MSRSLVSIAVTTYNGDRFLAAQLDSLIRQTYRPIEIVVSDDHSSDSTTDILEEYRRQYSAFFRWHRNESNLGYIKNFEKVLSLCRGEFLALCDQDDVWVPHKLAVLVRSIGDKDLIHSDARVVDEDGKIRAGSFTRHSKKDIDACSFEKLLTVNTLTGCTCVMRKSLFERSKPFPSGLPHDHWLALLASSAGGIGYVDEALVDYRQHDTNAIGAKNRKGKTRIALRHFSTVKLFQKRDETMASRWKKYRSLEAALRGRVPSRLLRIVSSMVDYYGSYFMQRIRFSAFVFHFTHRHLFQSNKSLAKHATDLLLSLVGHPVAFQTAEKNSTRIMMSS